MNITCDHYNNLHFYTIITEHIEIKLITDYICRAKLLKFIYNIKNKINSKFQINYIDFDNIYVYIFETKDNLMTFQINKNKLINIKIKWNMNNINVLDLFELMLKN